jgi:hypothetical protein
VSTPTQDTAQIHLFASCYQDAFRPVRRQNVSVLQSLLLNKSQKLKEKAREYQDLVSATMVLKRMCWS